MERTLLHENEWLSLWKMRDPDQGVHGYIYSHESRCQGQIVAILPYRLTPSGQYEFYIRYEVTPPWGMEPAASSITGGVEHAMTPMEAAREELWEEAGYQASAKMIESLGTCRGVKSSDTEYYLYAVDLTEHKQSGEATGDGSALEAQATMKWQASVLQGEDPLLGMLFTRWLYDHLPRVACERKHHKLCVTARHI